MPIISIPVDPQLPEDFYNTPNEERSDGELAQWWQKPYACTNADGSLDVRCLDGGAWDRPTFYGSAPDLPAACLLAERKLATWQWYQSVPVTCLQENTIELVVMPDRPGQGQPVVLARFGRGEQEAVNAWQAAWRENHPMPEGD